MTKTAAWIKAFRLRTLPLALSSILMGSFLALENGYFSGIVLALAISTTVFLQVLSNLANDYGDAVKGTDNEHRLGPERAMQSGAITQPEMKMGIIITAILALVSGCWLIYEGLKGFNLYYIGGFFVLGLGAIAAAVKYTMGKNPYGYSGLGDVFVFLFFGLTGVLGSYFLHAHTFDYLLILPASSIGLLSAAVLNMNNMRDVENDRNSGKNTLVVKIGARKARVYHSFLILGALACMATYIFINSLDLITLLCFVPLPVFVLNLKKVWSYTSAKSLDPELKKIALSTFLFTVLFAVGVML